MRWRRTNLVGMDRKTRVILAKNKAHYFQAAKERLYLPRSQGGRGLDNVELAWEREAVASTHYLMGSEDPQVKGAIKLQKWLMGRSAAGRRRGYSFVRQAQQVLMKYGLDKEELTSGKSQTKTGPIGRAITNSLSVWRNCRREGKGKGSAGEAQAPANWTAGRGPPSKEAT